MDEALHKEVVLKARLKPWLDEAYTLTTSIEGKLAILQETQQNLQPNSSGVVTKQMVEDTKQAVAQCTDEVVVMRVELGGLCIKISTPTK